MTNKARWEVRQQQINREGWRTQGLTALERADEGPAPVITILCSGLDLWAVCQIVCSKPRSKTYLEMCLDATYSEVAINWSALDLDMSQSTQMATVNEDGFDSFW